jgi:hypothetical protein
VNISANCVISHYNVAVKLCYFRDVPGSIMGDYPGTIHNCFFATPTFSVGAEVTNLGDHVVGTFVQVEAGQPTLVIECQFFES